MTTLLVSFGILEGLCASEIFFIYLFIFTSVETRILLVSIGVALTLPFSIVLIEIRQT